MNRRSHDFCWNSASASTRFSTMYARYLSLVRDALAIGCLMQITECPCLFFSRCKKIKTKHYKAMKNRVLHFLLLTCNTNYVAMQHNHVNLQSIHVNIIILCLLICNSQHNYVVNIRLNNVDM